ncbi:hypothetical protein [Neogemmobacter tilapiae]|uniref:Uncharacterized protein n=1 Tax=Neogemmobacter tilapiae TaxID=875041 RepID=A0A918TLU5_9RHOB|nr:hypothetical protein [Gemmobacter tilapiae]GHC47720.1 hypothetical protein GCM10007315_06980 [Gemmobacter tilapiae]
MSTDWITEVLRDLFRFAQLNQMNRLARDLELTLQGLEDEASLATRSNIGAESETAEGEPLDQRT